MDRKQTVRMLMTTLAVGLFSVWLATGCGVQADRAPEAAAPDEAASPVEDASPVEAKPPVETAAAIDPQPTATLPERADPAPLPDPAPPDRVSVDTPPVLVPARVNAAVPQPTPVAVKSAVSGRSMRMAPSSSAADRPPSFARAAESATAPTVAPTPTPAPAPSPDMTAVVKRLAPTPAPTPAEEPIEEPVASKTAATTETPQDDYSVVKVYYGTDRAAVATTGEGHLGDTKWQYPTLAAAFITVLLAIAAYRSPRRWLVGLAACGLLASVALGAATAYYALEPHPAKDVSQRVYGNQRGELELGTCRISIPRDHEVGELESPSVLRLEFREDPERHVVLLGVEQKPADEFFADLGGCVADSARKEAFVFVHGYNVTFEKAARRTAQLAHDLKFDGAPIFYSWPSQGGLLKYTIDETNVVWTVPHLKQFLVDVARRSGARSVHLIAHSMGNRALTSALRGLSYDLDGKGPMFREVVLTAPDIDADVFRRDIAPAIIGTADRVTLYASSNDEALAASKQVHGYPRAGESGENMVVVPGIETIDVSAVDTSLLGHTYYGDNDTVLTDLGKLLAESSPPDERHWLRAAALGQLKYWVFLRERLGLRPSEQPR